MEEFLMLLKKEGLVKNKNKKQNDLSDLEKNIVPINANLKKVRAKRGTKKKVVTIDRESETPLALVYGGEVSPFLNAHHFIRFYRACLRDLALRDLVCNGIRFDLFESDCTYATNVLDLLIENRRADKQFLVAWIRYFFDNNLKGNKSLKSKHTSIRTFADTFEKFNSTYFSV